MFPADQRLCERLAADGFDNIPEYVLMDSISDTSDVDASLFVESDSVCIRQLVAESIGEDCDELAVILN